jgi:hypothetical protein
MITSPTSTCAALSLINDLEDAGAIIESFAAEMMSTVRHAPDATENLLTVMADQTERGMPTRQDRTSSRRARHLLERQFPDLLVCLPMWSA